MKIKDIPSDIVWTHVKILVIFLSLFAGCMVADVAKAETIKIAVIDTGFDFKSTWNNSKDAKVPVPKLCKYGHKSFVGDNLDNHGHGTHIAGIIATFLRDIDYCLVIVKYYDPKVKGTNNLANTIKAIEHAINLDVDYINYSGGGLEFSPKEYKATLKAFSKGITIVAAAGNERSNTTLSPYYPASYNTVISVGNLHKTDRGLAVAKSSNFGDNVDMWAVGTNVYSLLPNNRYGLMSGTSQAAPKILSYLVIRDIKLKPLLKMLEENYEAVLRRIATA